MFTSLLILLLSVGHAQGPTIDLSKLLANSATNVTEVAAPASPNTRYASADVSMVRWVGQPASSGTLKQGDTVEIVVRGDGGLVRVRRGTDFGWVPEASLSSTPVAPAPEPEVPPADAPEGESPADEAPNTTK